MPSGRPNFRPAAVTISLGLLAIALQAVAALTDSLAIHEREELYNAAHAWIVRGEGPDLLLPFQYQWFCGGCSVDAVLGAGWFELFGPSVFAWRLVGVTWFALALVAGMVAAHKVAGHRAAAAVALLFALAPPAYQELGLISNGNHPEGGALLALQLMLAVITLGAPRTWQREGLLAAQAALVGFGLFFLRSLVIGLPLLAASLLLTRTTRRGWLFRLPLVLLSLRVGAAPLFAVRDIIGTWPLEPVYQADEWRLSLEWVPRNFLTLFHPTQLRGIWGDVSGAAQGWLGLPAFGGWALLVGGLGWALVRWQDSPEGKRGARQGALMTMGLLATFLGLYLVYRLAVSMNGQGPPYPQQARYLGVIAPAALCAAGMGAGLVWRTGPRRWLVGIALVALCLPGAGRRWRGLHQATWGAATARTAPDWCFQAERLRGSRDQLDRAGRHTPWPLFPYAAGTLVGDPRTVLEIATEPEAVPFLKRPGTDDPAARRAWERGRVTGAAMRARDEAAGSFTAWQAVLVGLLADDPPPSDVLLESAWCQGRNQLMAGPQDEPPTEPQTVLSPGAERLARSLLGAARGAHASLACPERTSATERVVRWGPTCPSWLPGLGSEAVGWGLGIASAEYWGFELERVRVIHDSARDDDIEDLQAGFERGWRYGQTLYWQPGQAPLPTLEVVESMTSPP